MNIVIQCERSEFGKFVRKKVNSKGQFLRPYFSDFRRKVFDASMSIAISYSTIVLVCVRVVLYSYKIFVCVLVFAYDYASYFLFVRHFASLLVCGVPEFVFRGHSVKVVSRAKYRFFLVYRCVYFDLCRIILRVWYRSFVGDR